MFTNASNSTNGTAAPQEREPDSSRMFRFIVLGVIMLVSVVGNTMVVYITYTNRFMRTFAYVLIANLAVADVLSSLILPFLVVYMEKGRWIFGEALCKIINPSFTVFSIVTTNTLVAIACDRSRALLFPFKLKPSTSETRLIIAIIWLLAFLVSLPSYGSRTIDYGGFCLEIYTDDPEKQVVYGNIYTTFTFLFNNLIPLLVILVLYLKITMALKHISLIPQSFQLNRPSSLAGQDTPGGSPKNSVFLRNANVAAANKRQKMESKFIRMLLVVVLIFLFCYVPFQVFFMVWVYVPLAADAKTLFYINHYLFVLMWVPNALNPICYAALNERYAKAVKQLVCSSFTRIKRLGTGMTSPKSTYSAAATSRRKSSPLSV
ncbi:hypothetical protein QZH41_003941 [Actinostola sp. cb2023]|nr:hypothetical protein QZH41_003941 [Actinostola sp. cb2023]